MKERRRILYWKVSSRTNLEKIGSKLKAHQSVGNIVVRHHSTQRAEEKKLFAKNQVTCPKKKDLAHEIAMLAPCDLSKKSFSLQANQNFFNTNSLKTLSYYIAIHHENFLTVNMAPKGRITTK